VVKVPRDAAPRSSARRGSWGTSPSAARASSRASRCPRWPRSRQGCCRLYLHTGSTDIEHARTMVQDRGGPEPAHQPGDRGVDCRKSIVLGGVKRLARPPFDALPAALRPRHAGTASSPRDVARRLRLHRVGAESLARGRDARSARRATPICSSPTGAQERVIPRRSRIFYSKPA